MKNISLKLFPLLIGLLFVFPILKENWSTLFLILTCLNVIVYSILTKDFRFDYKVFYLTIPFWIIVVTSLFSSNFSLSAVHIQHALFFLIVPVFFSKIPEDVFNKQKVRLYFLILKITCVAIAAIYIVSFFLNNPPSLFFVVFQNVSTFRDYVYYDFTLFKIHPTYYTIILILCSAHSFDLVLKEKKYRELFFIGCFLLITFLLTTRLNIVVLIGTLFVMIFSRSSLSTNKKIIAAIGFICVAVALTFFVPGIKTRFSELAQSFNVKPETVFYDSTNIRKAIFDCSVAVTKDHWLTGVGFDQLQSEINNCYQSNYNSQFYIKNNYLTHNYFFYILISSGFIGFSFFLGYLFYLLRLAKKMNLFLFYVFLISVLFVCCIEDYMYRHYGCLYFNLLLMTFYCYSQSKKTEEFDEKLIKN